MAEQQNAAGIATIDALGEYFARGAKPMRARIGADAVVAPELMVRISFAAVLACELFKDWLCPAGEYDPGEIHQAVTRLLMDGLYSTLPAARKPSDA